LLKNQIVAKALACVKMIWAVREALSNHQFAAMQILA